MAGMLKECKLCRKLFSSSAGKVCADCTKYLDEIYPTVRSFIRDNATRRLEVAEISDDLGLPIRYVQGLVDCGYLGRDLPHAKPSEEDSGNRDKLANELSKATEQLRAQTASRKNVTYGQERYSQGKK